MDKDIIVKLRDYFAKRPVTKAWLFGSFARGEETVSSDVDIIVSLPKDKKIGFLFFTMLNELEALLSRKVDLVEEGTLDPNVVAFVSKDKYLIYERTIAE